MVIIHHLGKDSYLFFDFFNENIPNLDRKSVV